MPVPYVSQPDLTEPAYEVTFSPDMSRSDPFGLRPDQVADTTFTRVMVEIKQRGNLVLRLEAVAPTVDQPIYTVNPAAFADLVAAANAWEDHQRKVASR